MDNELNLFESAIKKTPITFKLKRQNLQTFVPRHTHSSGARNHEGEYLYTIVCSEQWFNVGSIKEFEADFYNWEIKDMYDVLPKTIAKQIRAYLKKSRPNVKLSQTFKYNKK